MVTKKPEAILFIEYRNKLSSVKSAQEAGYKAILVTSRVKPEAFRYFDEVIERDIALRPAVDDLVLYIKQKYKVRAILSNYEYFVVQRSYLAEHFGLPSSSVYSACCTRNKLMQRHALAFMKENIDYCIVKTRNDILAAFKTFNKDMYLKSIAGVKSQYVYHVKNQIELEQAWDNFNTLHLSLDNDLYNDFSYFDFKFHYPNPKTTLLAEKAVYGQQVSVLSLVDSYRIWHAPSVCDIYTARDIGRDDSFLAFRILPSKQSLDVIDRCYEVATTAMRILGLQYCGVHTELLITPKNEIKIVEIASRLGGYRTDMYQRAYDLDISALLIRAVLNKKIKVEPVRRSFVSMMEIFPQKNGILQSISSLPELQNDPSISELKVKAQVGQQVGRSVDNFRSVLSFMISGRSYEEVYEKSCYFHKNIIVEVNYVKS